MKNWNKTSLITAVVLGLFITGVIYVFSLKIVKTSSQDVDFSPAKDSEKALSTTLDDKPKNIIIFIADGFGFSHLALSRLTQPVEGVSSVWQEFDVKGWHDARSAYGPLTDSEASATAMATGTSTNFGHIGIDKNGNKLKNIFEVATEQEYNTAIVTDSYIWDGTPAAFVAHTRNEDDARDILTQIASSDLDLIFGELEDLGEGLVPEKEETIQILSRRFQLLDKSLKLPGTINDSKPIAAIFDEDEVQDLDSSPNLPQLTDVALDHLSSADSPFVLLVECEEMDSGSHRNNSDRVVRGLKSIEETLANILSFAKANGDTLVLFTADHETGGLALVSDDNYPNMQLVWATGDHTASLVPLFAKGPGATYFSYIERNWEIGNLLKRLISSN